MNIVQSLTWILLIIGAVALIATFYMYASGNKGWFKSPIGQLLLSLSGSLLLWFLWAIALRLFVFSVEVRAIGSMILFIILDLTLVWRAVIIARLKYTATNGSIKDAEGN